MVDYKLKKTIEKKRRNAVINETYAKAHEILDHVRSVAEITNPSSGVHQGEERYYKSLNDDEKVTYNILLAKEDVKKGNYKRVSAWLNHAESLLGQRANHVVLLADDKFNKEEFEKYKRQITAIGKVAEKYALKISEIKNPTKDQINSAKSILGIAESCEGSLEDLDHSYKRFHSEENKKE